MELTKRKRVRKKESVRPSIFSILHENVDCELEQKNSIKQQYSINIKTYSNISPIHVTERFVLTSGLMLAKKSATIVISRSIEIFCSC